MIVVKNLKTIIFGFICAIVFPTIIQAKTGTICDINEIVQNGVLTDSVSECDIVSISNNFSYDDLVTLSKADIKELNFYSAKVDDLAFINSIDSLKVVKIDNSIVNLENIKSNIEELSITNSIVYNSYNLKNCKNVNKLIIDWSYIRDFSFLKYLTGIKELEITNIFSFEDFSAITKLDKLEKINLTGSEHNITAALFSFINDKKLELGEDLSSIFDNQKQIEKIYESLELDNLSDLEKVQKIVLYVLDNMEYDESLLEENRAFYETSTGENMLKIALTKKGVCRHYSFLTSILLSMAGINNIPVLSTFEENHVWNYIYLDDQWLALDTTWLDNEEGRTKVENNIRDTYFLVNPTESFLINHHPRNILLTSNFNPIFKITLNAMDKSKVKYVNSNDYIIPSWTFIGYNFKGWYLDDNYQTKFENKTLQKDLNLFAKLEQNIAINNNKNMCNNKGNFKKYDLSSQQLQEISALINHIESNLSDASFIASLMANRFELYGKKHGSGADGLYNYIKNSHYFADTNEYMNSKAIAPEEIVNVVRSVLVNGRRTIPSYIDEYDSLSAISSASVYQLNIEVNEINKYQPHLTEVMNKFGSKYMFYIFNSQKEEVFGYTSEEKRKNLSDDCYVFNFETDSIKKPESSEKITNPKTGIVSLFTVIGLLIVSTVLYIKIKKKKIFFKI